MHWRTTGLCRHAGAALSHWTAFDNFIPCMLRAVTSICSPHGLVHVPCHSPTVGSSHSACLSNRQTPNLRPRPQQAPSFHLRQLCRKLQHSCKRPSRYRHRAPTGCLTAHA